MLDLQILQVVVFKKPCLVDDLTGSETITKTPYA